MTKVWDVIIGMGACLLKSKSCRPTTKA